MTWFMTQSKSKLIVIYEANFFNFTCKVNIIKDGLLSQNFALFKGRHRNGRSSDFEVNLRLFVMKTSRTRINFEIFF